MRYLKTAALYMALLLGVLAGIYFIASDDRKVPGAAELEAAHPEKYALYYCREFTTKSLHDPSSALFDDVYPSPTPLPDRTYRMTLSLHAKNGFGAMRHFAVSCTVRFDGTSWSLVSLEDTSQ